MALDAEMLSVAVQAHDEELRRLTEIMKKQAELIGQLTDMIFTTVKEHFDLQQREIDSLHEGLRATLEALDILSQATRVSR